MLTCVCSVMDHWRRQNVVRPSVTHSVVLMFCSYHSLTSSLTETKYRSLGTRQAPSRITSSSSQVEKALCTIQQWISFHYCSLECVANNTNLDNRWLFSLLHLNLHLKSSKVTQWPITKATLKWTSLIWHFKSTWNLAEAKKPLKNFAFPISLIKVGSAVKKAWGDY